MRFRIGSLFQKKRFCYFCADEQVELPNDEVFCKRCGQCNDFGKDEGFSPPISLNEEEEPCKLPSNQFATVFHQSRLCDSCQNNLTELTQLQAQDKIDDLQRRFKLCDLCEVYNSFSVQTVRNSHSSLVSNISEQFHKGIKK